MIQGKILQEISLCRQEMASGPSASPLWAFEYRPAIVVRLNKSILASQQAESRERL